MPNNVSGSWAGWGYFGSMMLLILGVLQAISGLAAIFKDDFFSVGSQQLIAFNFTAWGWILLVLGVLVFMAGLEMMRGALWARVPATLLAGLSFVASMAFLNAYPVWALVTMVVDLLAIYALTVRGDGRV